MAELRSVLEEASFENVSTYIQSGNIIFDSGAKANTIESTIHDLIEEHFDYDVPVMVRTRSFFEQVVAKNPFPKLDTAFLCATILATSPGKKLISEIDASAFGDDTFQVLKNVVYVHCPNGFGRTKLTNGFFEKKLKTRATSRNWKTINKLIELSG